MTATIDTPSTGSSTVERIGTTTPGQGVAAPSPATKSAQPTPPASAPEAPSSLLPNNRLRWFALGALSLGVASTILNQTISNVAIPAISADIGLTTAEATWVNASYALTYASLLLMMGRIADLIGRRRVFLIGVAIFALSSVGVALTDTVAQIVAARVAQGIGAAMILPSSLSLVNAVFRGRDRAIAFAVWGSVIGGVSAMGPLLGGWILGFASWQWAFLINAPVGILTAVLTLKFIPDSREDRDRTGLDVVGAVMATVGLALLIFGIIEGSAFGWLRTLKTLQVGGLQWTFEAVSPTAAALVMSIVLIASFVAWEQRRARRGRSVLFELSLYKVRSFRYGTLVGLLVSLGEFGVLFALSLFLQAVYGYSALQAGAVLATLAAGAFIGTGAAVRFSQRRGPAWTLRMGMIFEVAGIVWLAFSLTPSPAGWALVPPLVVYGMGVGFATSQLAGISLSQVPREKSGQASGAQSTSRALGAAVGTSVLGATLLAGFGATTSALTDRGVSLETAQRVTEQLRATAGTGYARLESLPNGKVLLEGAAQGYSTAIRLAALVAAGFIIIGLIASFLLPNTSLSSAPGTTTGEPQKADRPRRRRSKAADEPWVRNEPMPTPTPVISHTRYREGRKERLPV